MPPFINGILIGLIFLFSLGPAFFALIQTSIQHGFRKAMFFAIGISLSDVLFVLVILFGLAKILNTDSFKFWMAIFGSIMLTGYAIYSWVKKPVVEEVEMTNDANFAKYALKGFVLNGLNPFIIVSWATWVGTVAVKFDYNFAQQLQFFVGMLVSILSLDLIKAFVANKLKHMITVKFVRKMNRVVAVIIFVFALQVVYYLFDNYA
ncbi:MAG: LysE family transporter [Cyclobacteriaceae bacterium]